MAKPNTSVVRPDRAQSQLVDVVVVGAGFSGLYMLHRLRALAFSTRAFEAASGVGGTWYWNRYPGARCDVESMQYSFSFLPELEQDWHWSERYAAQPEILTYAEHVADRLDLRPLIQFDTRVVVAAYDDPTGLWTVRTDRGDVVRARFCIMATGCLSTAKLPEIPGQDRFRGRTYHTGAWPHEGVDFAEQTVGVIGTGSSAIQAIPVIAEQAAKLVVFQRTPNFSVPAHNRPITPAYEQEWKAEYAERRRRAKQIRNGILYELNDRSALDVTEDERLRIYEARWGLGGFGFMASFNDLIVDQRSNETAAEFVRTKIRAIVKDPAVAEMLTPKGYPIGTKRLCVDTAYFETYNRDNVTLVDVRNDPIERLEPDGLRTRTSWWALDSIVFATGFDAMTGTLQRIDITGRGGLTLAGKWAEGPRTYLGLMTTRFPNLFLVTGPGSPSVLSNMMVSIEQHVDWIADCLAYLRAQDVLSIEASGAAEDDWVAHVNEVADRTLYPRANSWYVGANVPGKPRVFMPYIGGIPLYHRTCDEIAADGYRGFLLRERRMAAAQ